MTSLTVDVVLPCLDEAAALPWVLARIPAGWRALVVDNGSRDGSPDVARRLGAYVVAEPRRGYGAACHAGLLAATADVVCFCDCDATLDPGLLAGFVRTLAAGEADLVLARRRPAARGAWPAHARAAHLALSVLLRRRTGLRLHDLGPLRAAPRRALLDLALTDRRSGYPLQTVVRAADAGWRVREVDVPYLPREGTSKVTGTWRGTWQAVRDMRKVLADGPPVGTAPPAPSAPSAPSAPVRQVGPPSPPAPVRPVRPSTAAGSRRRAAAGAPARGEAPGGDAAGDVRAGASGVAPARPREGGGVAGGVSADREAAGVLRQDGALAGPCERGEVAGRALAGGEAAGVLGQGGVLAGPGGGGRGAGGARQEVLGGASAGPRAGAGGGALRRDVMGGGAV